MLSPSPQDWLARYASHGDQAAFSALVRTQAPLVWRTAMRRLGDAQLAEEAVQNVFLTLARKSARLATRPGLSAWLHRAAVLEASVLARSRSRREKRHLQLSLQSLAETEAAAASSAAPDSPAGLWLDEALNRLPAADRSLLLGRYFEERSYEELGGAMGKSGEAAKKQAQRALGKVGDFLRRRGLTLSSSGLASLAAAEFSSAAPTVPPPLSPGGPGASALPEALQKLLPSTASGPVPVPPAGNALPWFHRLSALMSTSKMTLSAAALLLLLLGTSGWQASANASLRAQIQIRQAALEKQAQASASGTTASKNKTPTAPVIPLPDPLDGATMVRVFASNRGLVLPPVPDNWSAAIRQRYQRADVPEMLRLLGEVDKAQGSESLRRALIDGLVMEDLTRLDPELAVKIALERGLDGSVLKSTMIVLAKKDPEAADKFFTALSEAAPVPPTRAHDSDPLRGLLAGIGEVLANSQVDGRTSPAALLSFADKHLSGGHVSDILSASSNYPVPMTPGPFLDLATRVTDPEDQRKTFAFIAEQYWAYQPGIQNLKHDDFFYQDGVLQMRIYPDPREPDRQFAPVPDVLADPRFPAEFRQSALREAAGRMLYDDPWSALVKMDRLSPPATREDNLAWLAARLDDAESANLKEAPALADAGDQRILDSTVSATARALAARGNPALAHRLAGQIRDSLIRSQILSATAP